MVQPGIVEFNVLIQVLARLHYFSLIKPGNDHREVGFEKGGRIIAILSQLQDLLRCRVSRLQSRIPDQAKRPQSYQNIDGLRSVSEPVK